MFFVKFACIFITDPIHKCMHERLRDRDVKLLFNQIGNSNKCKMQCCLALKRQDTMTAYLCKETDTVEQNDYVICNTVIIR